MPFARNAPMTGFTSFPDQNKITRDGGFTPAGRLEIDRRRYAHWPHRNQLHSAFHEPDLARRPPNW